MGARPYSPETLAERWDCSAEKIRRMYHDGELAGFRLGKLIRIPAAEVERYECQTTSLDGTEESAPSFTGTKTESAFAGHLVRQMKGSPTLALVNSGRSSMPPHRNG